MKVHGAHSTPLLMAVTTIGLTSVSAGAQTAAFTFTQLDFPGSLSTEMDGINAEGEIIGFFVDKAGKQHGFLHQPATVTQLDFPGATATRTVAINDAGVIASSLL